MRLQNILGSIQRGLARSRKPPPTVPTILLYNPTYMPGLLIALVIGWAAAAWLAYQLIIARGRLLLHTARPSSSPQRGAEEPHGTDEQDAREIFLPELDLHLDREHAYFLHALTEAHALKEAGAYFRRHEDGRLLCEVGGITVVVRSVEEM